MHFNSLIEVLSSLKSQRVVVLGDVMLDRFIYGSVHRISPEAPIPVVAVERSTDMPGGAANVVRNVAALGGQATLVGVTGQDPWAEELDRLIRADPTVEPRLVADASRPTTVKIRYVADGQQVMRADHERSAPVDISVGASILAEFESAISNASVVVLSDYAKGVLTPEVVRNAIELAKAAGLMVIVDPKSKDFFRYAGASILTPNRSELQAATGSDCATDEACVAGARKFIDAGVCEAIVVTRSAQGMTVVTRDAKPEHLRAVAREVFDVSGAGDTVVATLAGAIAAGADLASAARIANVAAAIVVGKRGTAVATAGEIAAALSPADHHDDKSKIFAWEPALELAHAWREQGLKIGFTNGCFDLLHPGHISLLEQARATCDRLIVGLNADVSIKRLKGNDRPIQDEISRAIVLSSLKSVDAVVIFAQDTPLELITALEPDVLVKGADYTVDTVVGSDVVKARGGRVVLAELVPGHSTTRTVSTLRRREA